MLVVVCLVSLVVNSVGMRAYFIMYVMVLVSLLVLVVALRFVCGCSFVVFGLLFRLEGLCWVW